MCKFPIKPSKFHYEPLKRIVQYLCKTKDWGIKYKQSVYRNFLVTASLTFDVIPNENLPPFPVGIYQQKLTAFITPTYANVPHKQQSTTGLVFTYCSDTIVYCSKTQSIHAISSTEAEFLAIISCAKISLHLGSILYELDFECDEPTPTYKDNASAILIVHYTARTECARHNYVKYLAIQDLKEWGCIQLIYIPCILNPSNNLTKLLGWIVHSRYCSQFMGHYA